MHGRWEWVAAGAFLQAVYYLTLANMYRSAFDTVEVKARVRDILPVVFGSIFVNVVAPSGGASGAALFVDDAARRGESPARAMAGTLLTLICDFSAFSLALIVGLIYLYSQHDLKLYQIVGSVILFSITLGMAGVLFLGYRTPFALRRLLYRIQKTGNHLAGFVDRLLAHIFPRHEIREDPLFSPDWAEKNAIEFQEAGVAISVHPLRLVRTLAIAILAHVIDLVNLFVLFLAYGEVIRLGPLIAGYAVGILFWIVSITPQGIGVVEGVMALVYTTVGIPAEIATVVTLAFRGLTFWLPLAIGFVLLQRMHTFSTTERSRADVWNVRAVAILTGIMGIINIFSGMTPNAPNRVAIVEQFSPLLVRRGSHLTSILAGIALILLARNLWHRKRIAWVVAIVVLVISSISHIFKGFDYEEAFLAAALALWLLMLRNHFHARSDPPSVQQGLRVLVMASIVTLVYGVAGFYLLDRHFNRHFGLEEALRQTFIMFTTFYDPGLVPITGFGRFFANSIYVVASVTFGYAIFMLARPVLLRVPASPDQRLLAQRIVEAYGCSSLARFTLMPDKSYFFSPGGTLFTFVPRNGIALVLGDPIGPPADFNPALQAFREYCIRNDWEPAFYQTLPDWISLYETQGYQALCIGHEAITDVKTFTLEGRTNKSLRSSYNHIAKLGYQAQYVPPPLPDPLLSDLRNISDEWLTFKQQLEMRFSLGWFDDDYIRNSQVMLVVNSKGVVTAFANILPEYQRNEVGLDLMRYLPEVENGTMEYLFVSLINWARERGYDTFNMGLSALSGLGESSNVPTVERALRFIYEHINQFYNFQGLHRFKEKFNPAWSPRYLIYPSSASLPAIAIALVQADSGEDLLTLTWKELAGQTQDLLHRLRRPKTTSELEE